MLNTFNYYLINGTINVIKKNRSKVFFYNIVSKKKAMSNEKFPFFLLRFYPFYREPNP
jgi:hypothetical protein